MKYLFAFAAVVAAAMVGGVAGCGGEERLSRDEFSDRLQRIDERGSELYGQLAEGAQHLDPDEPLPAEIEQALTALVQFQEQAAVELEGLNPPEDAEQPVASLIEALRERTETFEEAVEAGRFTEQNFERVIQSGEEIDEALELLRAGGFLAGEKGGG